MGRQGAHDSCLCRSRPFALLFDFAGGRGKCHWPCNPLLPSGNIEVGDLNPMVATNAIVRDPHELGDVPLRLGSNPTVFVRDVARVVDGADIVYNVATVNGRPTVYMTVIKRADASTVNVVDAVKAALPQMRLQVPPDVHIDFEFDQSVYVKNAIRSLL